MFDFRIRRWAIGILALILCLVPSAFAQVQTGGIEGTVTDATGAAIPGASVTITAVDTGITRQLTTDSEGRYSATSLNIGNYRIQATMQGFAPQTQQGLTLAIGQVLTANFTMQVGTVSQEVTVNATAAPQVNITTSETGALVESTQLQELPLNGRNAEQLVALAPAVQPVQGAPAGGANFGNAQRYSIAGARVDSGAVMLDGLEIRGFWGAQAGLNITGTSLGVESIAEFNTITSSANAQYNGASVLNEVTRSGTNSLHGSAYGYFRNSAMDARNFFDPTTGPPAFHRNQFGGSVGGPLQKNKTFFFANYEGIRAQLALRDTLIVPDANAHAGMLPCTANNQPACGANQVGTLTAVPINANVQPYFALYPNFGAAGGPALPPGYAEVTALVCPIGNPTCTAAQKVTVPTGTASFIGNVDQPQTEDYFALKLDHQMSAANNLSFRWVVDRGVQTDPFIGATNNVGSPGVLPAAGVETDPEANWYGTIQDRHIFSANLINVATFGFVRTNQQQELNENNVPAIMKKFTQYGDVGSIVMTNVVATLGFTGTVYVPLQQLQNNFIEQDEVDWVHGAHSFKFGGGVTRIQCNCVQAANAGGQWTFSSLYNFLANSPSQYVGAFTTSPLPIAAAAHRYARQTNFNMFVQDDWRATRRVTLNLGIRYDYITNPTEAANNFYDVLHVNPLTCGGNYSPPGPTNNAAPAGDCTPDSSISTGFTNVPHMFASNPSTKNIDPRIGLAWDIFGDGKTSFRASYGIFHELIYPRFYTPGSGFVYPNGTTQLNFAAGSGAFPVVAGTLNAPLSRTKPNYIQCCTPYMEEWSATLERQLPWGLKASLGYIGSLGVHLYDDQNFNTLIPNAGTQFRPLSQAKANTLPVCVANPASAACTSLYAGYGINGAGLQPNSHFTVLQWFNPSTTSNYNAGIITVTRNMRGVNLSSSFTYDRCLDYGSSSTPGIDEPGDSETYVYPAVPKKYNYGLCAFNISKNWTTSAVIPLPFHGNQLKEGWQIGTIASARTGTPETASLSSTFDQQNMGQYFGLTERPNVNPSFTGPLYSLNKAVYESGASKVVPYVNPSAFTPGPIGLPGNASRSTIIAPNLVNVDLSIMKNTRISKFGEAAALELRGDFFNAMNHTNMSLPNVTMYNGSIGNPVANGAAGAISTTSTSARQLQFSARFVF